jgi:hypothetical protein
MVDPQPQTQEEKVNPLKDSFLGFVRHALTTAGGFMVAGGYVSDAELGTVVGGIVVVAGVLWSMMDKYLRSMK